MKATPSIVLPAGILIAVFVFGPPLSSAQRSRESDSAAGIVPLSLLPAWEVAVPDSSAPYIVGTDDTLIVATPEGRLAAHDQQGREIWQVTLDSGIVAPPVGGAGRLIIPTEAAVLLLLETSTGRRIGDVSRSTVPPVGSAGPEPVDSRVTVSLAPSGIVAGYPDGVVLLADASNGSRIWETTVQSPPSTAAVQCGEILVVGTVEGTLVGLSAGTGRMEWARAVAEGPITTPVVCRGKRAYVGSADNRIHALKLKKKGPRSRWSYLTGGDVVGRPFLFEDHLIFTSYDTYVYALNADNGHLSWKVRLGRRPRRDHLLMKDLLVIAPLNTERLAAFRLPGGANAGSLSLPRSKERFVTAPVRVGDIVVVVVAKYGEDAARVIALEPAGPGIDQPDTTAAGSGAR